MDFLFDYRVHHEYFTKSLKIIWNNTPDYGMCKSLLVFQICYYCLIQVIITESNVHYEFHNKTKRKPNQQI